MSIPRSAAALVVAIGMAGVANLGFCQPPTVEERLDRLITLADPITSNNLIFIDRMLVTHLGEQQRVVSNLDQEWDRGVQIGATSSATPDSRPTTNSATTGSTRA